MRIKLTVLGVELFEFNIGREEDWSQLLPLLVNGDDDKIHRFGGNDECSFEIDPEQVDLFEPDEEYEEEVPEMFGFHT